MHVSSSFDFNRFGVQVCALFFGEAQDFGHGISNEVLLFWSEAGIGVFDHGSKVGASVGALIGEDQVLGLCQMHSRTQGLHQLVQVLRVVVVSGIVQERTVLVAEMFFVLTMCEPEVSKVETRTCNTFCNDFMKLAGRCVFGRPSSFAWSLSALI